MRFHRLTMEGIGSFVAKTTVDFDVLGKQGLFLIHGDTGAGKSTILDAIVYALYGHVAGHGGSGHSSDKRLLSYYWDKNTPPFVQLVFSANDTYYEVKRTIEFTKAGNKRPTKATAELRLSHSIDFVDARDVSAGIEPVNRELKRIINLGENHFLQTVLLPQGQVQKFLTADPSQRYEVLKELFQAQIYTEMERVSRQHSQQGEANLDAYLKQHRTAVETLISDMNNFTPSPKHSAAWSELVSQLQASLDQNAKSLQGLDDAVATPLLQAINVLQKETARLEQERQDAQRVDDAAQAAFTRASETRRVIEQAKRWREQLEEMNLQTEEIAKLKAQNDAAAKANDVVNLAQNRDVPRTQAREHHQAMCQHLGDIRVVEPSLEGLKPATKLLSDLDATDLPAAIIAKTKMKPLMTALGTEIETQKHALEKVAEKHRQKQQYEAELQHAKDEAAQGEALIREQEARLKTLKEDEAAALAAWIAADAPRLARKLVAGEPCPVCGSTQHPHPAQDSGANATLQGAESARQRTEKAQQELEQLRNKVARANAIIERLQEDIAALGDQIRAELPDDSADAEVETLFTSLASAQEHLTQLRDAYEDWSGTLLQWSTAQRNLDEALVKHGFDDLETARAASMKPEELKQNQQRVDDFTNEKKQLEIQLNTDEYRGKEKLELPEVDKLREAAQATREALNAINAEESRLKLADSEVHKSQHTLHESRKAWDKENAEVARWKQLADVIERGDNPMKCTLTAYYLGERLKQVVETANIIVRDISRGYYEIRHADDDFDSKDRKYHHLGIEMYNAAVDKAISAKSLSGGEQFYFSLGIALALSQVVQAEHGGIELENIFIDEGFGSLDDTTRTAVMETLRDLHSRGRRSVGIISHVNELQDEIPTGIEVRNYKDGTEPGKRGSYLTVYGVD